MKTILLLAASLLISPSIDASETETQVVESFVEAYNQQDVVAMLKLTTSDVNWMSVESKTLSVITEGQEQLNKAMQSFFESGYQGQSEILNIHRSGNFVHTVEKAIWSTDGEEKSQCSFAVYELKEEKIANVWYYPAHQCVK